MSCLPPNYLVPHSKPSWAIACKNSRTKEQDLDKIFMGKASYDFPYTRSLFLWFTNPKIVPISHLPSSIIRQPLTRKRKERNPREKRGRKGERARVKSREKNPSQNPIVAFGFLVSEQGRFVKIFLPFFHHCRALWEVRKAKKNCEIWGIIKGSFLSVF